MRDNKVIGIVIGCVTLFAIFSVILGSMVYFLESIEVVSKYDEDIYNKITECINEAETENGYIDVNKLPQNMVITKTENGKTKYFFAEKQGFYIIVDKNEKIRNYNSKEEYFEEIKPNIVTDAIQIGTLFSIAVTSMVILAIINKIFRNHFYD